MAHSILHYPPASSLSISHPQDTKVSVCVTKDRNDTEMSNPANNRDKEGSSERSPGVLGACSPLDGTLLGGSLFSPNVCHERLSLPSPSSLGAEPHAQAPGSCPDGDVLWGSRAPGPCHQHRATGTVPSGPGHLGQSCTPGGRLTNRREAA